MDKETGRPKGFGFCEFYDQETAQSAMRNLNGHDVNGRSIRIDFAEDFQTRAPRGGGWLYHGRAVVNSSIRVNIIGCLSTCR